MYVCMYVEVTIGLQGPKPRHKVVLLRGFVGGPRQGKISDKFSGPVRREERGEAINSPVPLTVTKIIFDDP